MRVIATNAAGCGSSDEGTIPPGDADQLISLLDATQSDLQSGSWDLIAAHASEFAADVASLPDSVDQSVRDELSKAAKNLMALAKNPDQCGGASGASGAQGVESTSSSDKHDQRDRRDVSSGERSSTKRDDDRGAPSNNGNGSGQGNNGAGQGQGTPPAAPPPPGAGRLRLRRRQPGRRSTGEAGGVRRARSRRQGGTP